MKMKKQAAHAEKITSILLADDDPHVQVFLEHAFSVENRKCAISCFEDGEKLLEFLQKEKPEVDCVLLDLNMPRKNGCQTLEELKAKKLLDNTPVLVLSHSKYPSDVEAVMKSGASAFQEKPFGLEEYKLLVQKIISLTE